jgi:hypothetical protein
MPLTKAANYQAYAAVSLANAEAAKNKPVREVHLANRATLLLPRRG